MRGTNDRFAVNHPPRSAQQKEKTKMSTKARRSSAGAAGPGLTRVFAFFAVMVLALGYSASAWAQATVRNINFATSGLPGTNSITISGSRTNPAGTVAPYSVTFNSPGPSSNVGTKPVTSFSYSGFPSCVTVSGIGYELCGTSQTNPFTTPSGAGTTTVTATYAQLAINCPTDQQLQCGASGDPSNTGTATASCGSTVTVSHTDASAGGCTGQDIDRTWTATDACGNTANCVQHITFVDTTAPTIGPAGADDTIECPASPQFTPPTASDSCDPNASVVEVSDVITPGVCAGTYTETKTWKAVDACLNESDTVSQTITVVDTTAPVITCPLSQIVPADTGQCSASVDVGTATATDSCNCDVVISGVRSDAPLALSDPYPVGTTTITWTATDAEGNQSSCQQTVEVQDTQAPVITACAPNKSLTIRSTETSTNASPGVPTVSDNCGIASVVGVRDDGMALSDPYPAGPTPGSSKTTTITWTVTDVHGNTTTCQSTITVTRRAS
jgi:hypothetical protein